MKELIKIQEQNGENVVSARDLHTFLESKQRFTDWIKARIDKYEFVDGVDFTLHKIMIGRNRVHEYALTIDTAKEIAMVEGNNKGKQARRYFIECEKKLKSKALDFSDANAVLQLAQNYAVEQKKRLALEKKNAVLKPKADLMDKVIATDTKIDIGQTAKILNLPFGRNTLFKKLRENGVFFKNKNEPKQEYLSRGYFELKEVLIERENYDDIVKLKVLVTQKGLGFLAKKFDSKPNSPQLAMIV